MKAARFGVAVWTAASLGALEIEMLNGLVRDLNETTRFSTLPLAAPDNGAGVLAACGWMTGFPMRTGFGEGVPIHDPWRFDAERLVASGETDCVLWISAFGAAPPAWRERDESHRFVPSRTTQFAEEPNVRIAVGGPASIMTRSCIHPTPGTLVAMTASRAQRRAKRRAGSRAHRAPPRRGRRSAMLIRIKGAAYRRSRQQAR